MKDLLKGCVISITGDFGPKRTVADFKRWIEVSGAKFATSISASVTHLVCTKVAWKHQSPHVKAALKQPHTAIVSYDWLEDSLLAKKRENEVPYLCTVLSKQRQAKVQQCKTAMNKYVSHNKPAEKFNTGCGEARQDLQSDNYHVYQDETSFAYNIVLTRPDAEKLNVDKVTLKLYESNITGPSYYAVAATWDKHNPVSMKPSTHVLVPKGSPFHKAFAIFRRFFQQITGVEWDFRSFNNATPLNMAAKQTLRAQSWRIETVAPERLPRCREVAQLFLDGDHDPANTNLRHSFYMDARGLWMPSDSHKRDPTSAKDYCYHYRLPAPCYGEPRGTQTMQALGEACYGRVLTTPARVGGGTRAAVHHWS